MPMHSEASSRQLLRLAGKGRGIEPQKAMVLYDPMALWNNAHLLMFRLESKKLRGFHRQRRLTKRLQHFALPAAREP